MIWLPTVFAPSRRAVIATVLLASMVAATGLGAPVLGRWTLLEPTWGHLTQWGPTALALGVLLADPLGAATRPAHPTRPWFTLGLGLAIVTGTTLTAALTRGAGGASLIPLAAGLAASVALNSDDLSAHPRQATLRAVRAVCGVVLTLALVVPVVPAVDLLWRSALPGALAVLALVAASALRGGARWSSLTVGVLLLASAAYAWPGVPDDVFSGVLIGAIASVIVWIVGSTALLRGRALEAA